MGGPLDKGRLKVGVYVYVRGPRGTGNLKDEGGDRVVLVAQGTSRIGGRGPWGLRRLKNRGRGGVVIGEREGHRWE